MAALGREVNPNECPPWNGACMENTAKKLVGKYKLNSSRVHLAEFVRRAADSVPPGSRVLVLDAGAGDCRYAHLFGALAYESADFGKVEKAYGRLTYECDLTSIPAGALAVLLRPALFALSQVYARLDARHRYTGSGHCKNYCVIAQKPSITIPVTEPTSAGLRR